MFNFWSLACVSCGQALPWRRIGLFLLIRDGCKHCSFRCISSICWACFSDVMVSLLDDKLWRIQKAVVDHSGSRPPDSDSLFWCKLGFGKCFAASSWSNYWAGQHRLSYNIHLSSHVTVWWRNGSLLLCKIREDDTLKWGFFGFVVSLWGTHLLKFFTFQICFKCWTTTEWSMLSSLATSHVVIGGCQFLMAGHSAPHLQGSHFLCKTSWTTTELYVR